MKKKGFTLIELMIVLAIIAILAVVLIPKSTIFKKNSKTAGVTTNMNIVRAYLETKTADNALSDSDLLKAMSNNFTSSEAIASPMDKTYIDIVDKDGKKSDGTTSTSKSVIIRKDLTTAPTGGDPGTVIVYVGKYSIDTTTNKPTPNSSGDKDGYIVYGVDLDQNVLGTSYAVQK